MQALRQTQDRQRTTIKLFLLNGIRRRQGYGGTRATGIRTAEAEGLKREWRDENLAR